MPDIQVTVKFQCHIFWKLLQEFDNSNNRNTTIRRTLQVTEAREVNGKEYIRNLNETSREAAQRAGVKVSATASWATTSATVEGSHEASKILKDFVSSMSEVTQETKSVWEKRETQDYTIGPRDRLYFYQQTFSGPGMDLSLDVFSVTSAPKTPRDNKTVEVVIVSKLIEFIRDVRVVYGDRECDAPNDRVLERTFQSDNINRCFGGKYVWLVPVYTCDTPDASTSCSICIQRFPITGGDDLAKGAGGDYCYLFTHHDKRQNVKILEVKLLRSVYAISRASILTTFGPGWTGATRDINENRGGDYLYLVWRTH